jgi:hypothetical protein
MYRWLLVLALSVTSAIASAGAAQPVPAAVMTERAGAIARDAELAVSRLAQRRSELARRYQDELEAIDRLKNRPGSWRHERDLRDRMSRSLDTANQLSATTRELERARTSLAQARRAYLGAIESELMVGARPTRAADLARARVALVPEAKAAPARIVIPDLDVDPLADPEELDQRAAELRASEDQLGRQLARLDAQARELEHLALLGKQHERAGEVFSRDDDEPRRAAARRAADTLAPVTPSAGWDAGRLPPAPGGRPRLDSSRPVVLGTVIDASTTSAFVATQRSGDPMQRAEAAQKARNTIVSRLWQIKQRRSEIEARAHRLRGAR